MLWSLGADRLMTVVNTGTVPGGTYGVSGKKILFVINDIPKVGPSLFVDMD